MPLPATKPTVSFEASAAEPTASFSPRVRITGSGFDEELRLLLRSRLIIVNLLALVGGLLFVVYALPIPGGAQDRSIRPSPIEWLAFEALCVGFLGSSLVLWSRPGTSLRSLRVWEFLFFSSFTAHTAYVRFHLLTLDLHASAREDVIAFRGVFSLQPFIALILAYGVLIPNTLRRSLLAIGAILAVAFATIPAAAVVNPMLVARCLAKGPGDRFQTVADLGRALAGCVCAADWSAEQAAEWWQRERAPEVIQAEPCVADDPALRAGPNC